MTLECAGNGRALLAARPVSQPWFSEAVGTGAWRGTPLAPLLEEAGVTDGAARSSSPASTAGSKAAASRASSAASRWTKRSRGDLLLAYEMNGAPLLPQHGFPLRLVVPGWYGMTNVKWLTRITVVDEPFTGYQQTHAYLMRRDEDDPGEPLTRIYPRALMIPPGLPEFPTRDRTLAAGRVTIEGRAWSAGRRSRRSRFRRRRHALGAGRARARRRHVGPGAAGAFEWDAEPGEHVLCCRARDEAGNEQPNEADWNVGGYANNGIQRVPCDRSLGRRPGALRVELAGADRRRHVLRLLAVDRPVLELDHRVHAAGPRAARGRRACRGRTGPLTSSYSTPCSSSAFCTFQHGCPPNLTHMVEQRWSLIAIGLRYPGARGRSRRSGSARARRRVGAGWAR